MNRYNQKLRLVTPAPTSQAYAISPQQAQQLDRVAQQTAQAPVILVDQAVHTTSHHQRD